MAGEYNKSHEYETKAEEGGPVESQERGWFDFLGKKKEEEKPVVQEEEKPVVQEEEKPVVQEEVIATEFEKVKVSEPEPEPACVDYSKPAEHGYHHEEHKEEHKEEEVEKKHETLSEKLRRSDSSSSSSSDEEGDDEEKKKKRKEKKGLKEKIKEKISGDKEEEKKHGYEQDTDEIPVEKFHEDHGHAYDHGPVVPHHEEPKVEPAVVYAEEKKEDEKKGFLEKIKDKLPGHKKPEEVPVASPPAAGYETAEPAYHEGEPKEKKGLMEKIKGKIPGYHPKTEEEKEKEKPTGSY
ncbi:dehydrin ERD14-like isoform X2 [Argentina anserina]|uniref:dehydrin ERD14-like isoform X2 n=1 Tax=Argentina anserina TaxID=57926 RepID=UPI00217647F5|nr:dehydrin ERD14-like isoform X2 [Potentilla anserina]